jgi:probable HAF family extracellular repeat protein
MPAPYTNSAAAIGISTNGQVLLEGSDSQNVYHLFLNTNGYPFDIGTLPAPYNYEIFGSYMNSSGSFTGSSEATNYNRHAFLYSNGQMLDLGTLAAPYNSYSSGDGMNDKGQVVGESYDASGTYSHIFIYDHGQMSDLGDFGLQAIYSSSLNNFNQITGQAFDVNNNGFAFSYNSGQMNNLGALLPPPYNYYSRGEAINDTGATAVVGENTNYDTRAFLVISNVVTDLGTLALPFNAETQIVGVGGTANGLGRAFLYETGQMQDLNNLIDPKLGWRLIQGLAINDFGQIVGYGKINEAPQHHAYLLNPIRPPTLTGAKVASGQFSFMVSGVFPAQQIVMQSSTNLLDWLPMATNTTSGSVQSFAFTNQINLTIPAQYWRAVISQ